MKVGQPFFLESDVVKIARQLLGMELHTCFDGTHCSALIAETEAYAGITDRASHAWNGRKTKRTQTMYLNGGIAYVYLCYGIHHLFNIVTNRVGIPDAVLIRAVVPLSGIDEMIKRDVKGAAKATLLDGPGRVSKCMGINTAQDKIDLLGDTIWLEKSNFVLDTKEIFTSKRVGVDYAGDDAHLPYRFIWKTNYGNYC